MGVVNTFDEPSGMRFRYYETLQFLMCTVRGDYLVNNRVEAMTACIGEVKRLKPARLMLDMSQGKFSVVVRAVPQRAEHFKRLGMPQDLPTAYIVKEMTADCWFYQTAVRNMGWNMRLYANRDNAYLWLGLPSFGPNSTSPYTPLVMPAGYKL